MVQVHAGTEFQQNKGPQSTCLTLGQALPFHFSLEEDVTPKTDVKSI